MKKNFTIRHVSILQSDGLEVDLHNDVTLHRIASCSNTTVIELLWAPTVESVERKALSILFSGVHRLLVDNSRRRLTDEEGVILSHIGYLPSDEFGSSGEFLLEDDFDDNSTILLYFEDDSFISIDAESAHVSSYPTCGKVSSIVRNHGCGETGI